MSRTAELEKKVAALPGGAEFKDAVDGLPVEALKARITSLQQQLDESEEHKEANEALTEARATVSELVGPYNDVKKAVKVKTKYILELIKEKGGN